MRKPIISTHDHLRVEAESKYQTSTQLTPENGQGLIKAVTNRGQKVAFLHYVGDIAFKER